MNNNNSNVILCYYREDNKMRRNKKKQVFIDTVIRALDNLARNYPNTTIILETTHGTISTTLENALIYEGMSKADPVIVIDTE